MTSTVTADDPTVANLCETFIRPARRFAAERAKKFPHLALEFESAAVFVLFTAARSYVAKGPGLWGRMRFALYLSICVARKCAGVVAKEKNRHPIGFEVHGTDEAYLIADREPAVANAVADADELWQDTEDVLRLLDVLDDERRELFLRYHADGATSAQLSRELGVHASTVDYHLRRSMTKVLHAADTIKY